MVEPAKEMALIADTFPTWHYRESLHSYNWARGVVIECRFYIGCGYEKGHAIFHFADLWGLVAIEVWCGRRIFKYLYETADDPGVPVFDIVSHRGCEPVKRYLTAMGVEVPDG